LPPVPPRTYLVNKDPLPPINCQKEECAIASQHSQEASTNFTNYENTNTVLSNPFLTDNFSNAQPPVYENINKPFFKPVDGGDLDIGNGALSNTSLDVATPFTVLTISGVLLALRITLSLSGNAGATLT
jgi:hypothetical protein